MKRMIFLLSLIVLTMFILAACDDVEGTETDEHIDYEGMEVRLEVLENFELENTSLLKVNVINNSEKTFKGITNVWVGLEKWEIEIESLPPDQEVTRQFRHKYIKHMEDGYRYDFDGEFTDEVYTSSVEYELFEIEDAANAYNVRMEVVNKENVIEVTRDIYSKYGSNIMHIAFFGKDADLENYDYDIESDAEYYGNPNNYILVGSEKYDFKP